MYPVVSFLFIFVSFGYILEDFGYCILLLTLLTIWVKITGLFYNDKNKHNTGG